MSVSDGRSTSALAGHRRSTARDGLANRLQFWWLASPLWAPFWKVVQAIGPLRQRFNRRLIDSAILKAPVRPNRLSTRSDYTSWDSLTDRTWSARHLPPATIQDLPPAKAVAELFRQPDGVAYDRLSPKSTVLFPSFAQWFTDGFLRTDPLDVRKNTSNHEIDLSPLYGPTAAHTEALRAKTGGRLKSQRLGAGDEEYPPFLFETDGATPKAEFRLLPMPVGMNLIPELSAESKARLFATGGDRTNAFVGTAMLQTLFLREHNRVADALTSAYGWDDERVFQTARNVLIVLLIKIVVEEYINHITPYHFKFRAEPADFYTSRWYRTNWMAVEFSMVYRWHSLIPEVIRIGGQSRPGAATLFNNGLLVERGLGEMFGDLSSQPAGELGLFNTPSYLVSREENAINIGRANRLATYNDYRELVKFPRVTDFDQINGDPAIQAALRKVYGSVDRIELYPGLFAEDVRPRSALPPLIGRIVGIDAFSQAFTNPLLSENVFGAETFSPLGWSIIHETSRLEDIVNRNLPPGSPYVRATMTQPGQSVGE